MSNGRILVVDDEPQIRRVLRSALTKQGYIGAEARSGEEALEKLRDERYDVVILDRNMPGIGGLATCREIRSRSDVGIIMLTIRKAEEDKIEALDAGADDYVTKPFSMPELFARIRANLRRLPVSPQEGPEVVSFDGIEVNLGSRHVSSRGQDIRLTPKEFEVLQYLIAVWGPDYGNEVEYLHVFINQLRKKIEPDPSKPKFILTEPWVGYRLHLPKKSFQ
jgi:two-component system KDP operon response regulator KdpE